MKKTQEIENENHTKVSAETSGGHTLLISVLNESASLWAQFQRFFRVKRRRYWACGIVLAWFLFFFSTTGIFSTQDALTAWNTISTDDIQIVQDQTADKGYLVDTPGCKIERVLPFDERYEEITTYFEKTEPIKCNTGSNQLTNFEHGILTFDQQLKEAKYNNIAGCTSQAFYWERKDKNGVQWKDEQALHLDKPNVINDDFFLVQCKTSGDKVIYRTKYKQIIKKNTEDGAPFPERNPGDENMNVLILGIDSVSRNAFLRHAPELDVYIREQLGGIMMEGFNKIGDNTAVNIYSMVTGREMYSDWKTLMFSSWDNLGWIWQDYQKQGCVTLLLEETVTVKHPTLVKEFSKTPVTHYRRPDRIVAHDFEPVPQHSDENLAKKCYGPKHEFESILEWVADFSRVYRKNRYFGITFMSESSHDDLNEIGKMKGYLTKFLEGGKRDGTLNNTFILLHADHGFRMGPYFETPAGAYEARLPFMYITPPKWFHKNHKTAYETLRTNSHRLTTFYDLHKTLLAILHEEFSADIQTDNHDHPGKSLFTEIPITRTCEEAKIPAHFCACGSYIDVPENDPRARKAGQMLLNSLNNIVKSNGYDEKCVFYSDFTVQEAKAKVHYGMASNLENQEIYVTIETKPAIAHFRSTLRLQQNSPLIFHIERLDRYAPFVTCLDSNHHHELLPIACICRKTVDKSLRGIPENA